MLPGARGGYFAAIIETLGLTPDQVEALKDKTDDQLLNFVSGVATNASKALLHLQPAGIC